MKPIFGLVFSAFLASAAGATDGTEQTVLERWQAAPETIFDAVEINPADFLWLARPVVVFADTPADPRFKLQMDFITDQIGALVERDVIVIIDTDPAAKSELRQELRPRDFMLTLLGKDGKVKLRKPLPWDVRELTRSIDKMPLRQQELLDRRMSDG